MATVLRDHTRVLLLATLVGITTFATFYTMTVFTLSWGTAQLGFPRQSFLWLQIFGMLFFALGILGSSKLADRVGVRRMMIVATVSIVIFGLLFGPLFSGGSALSAAALLSLGLLCLGLEYGPLGLALAELFPTAVRYTGASLAFNVAGILGGSLAPYIATALAGDYGIAAVGYYLSAAALLTLIALLLLGPRVAAREHEPTSEPAEASLLSD
jgi:MFS family permease